MKMMYNGTPIKSLNIKHFEVSTNDCTMKASDLQAGVTGVARGKKIVGTGKCFEFAAYGNTPSNKSIPIPCEINTILISSTTYPVQSLFAMDDISNIDFSSGRTVANLIVNGNSNPIIVTVSDNMFTISCNEDVILEYFMGKDAYV